MYGHDAGEPCPALYTKYYCTLRSLKGTPIAIIFSIDMHVEPPLQNLKKYLPDLNYIILCVRSNTTAVCTSLSRDAVIHLIIRQPCMAA